MLLAEELKNIAEQEMARRNDLVIPIVNVIISDARSVANLGKFEYKSQQYEGMSADISKSIVDKLKEYGFEMVNDSMHFIGNTIFYVFHIRWN